ncbi:type II secretion system protein GspL [Candidatus Enterovibrio altilux]|uniref:Type II secretion system protein L n=1 Tax=Candidatus Enterovibrio altilux TaxID=1927128 RepID=A0A291B913_9GAMM|nr:type II secretion system protein GspL [Candidatus Enterovibrio luxaltus]ATF09485.1 General secretion pathway protein L [Candidatus Enterovibrio luxaltus]
MHEILTIRLNSDPQETIPWLVWSPNQKNILASGEAERLKQLVEYAKDREVMALADSAALTLVSVAIPSGSERQLETVLPYLLEDDLAQDIDQVHVTLLGKTGTQAHVAVIEQRIIQRWLTNLFEVGISLKCLVPDCLCLPQHDDAYSVAFFNNRWIVRVGLMQGCAAEAMWLPIWLQSATASNSKTQQVMPVVCYSELLKDAPENWRFVPSDLIILMLAQGASQSHYSLLTGRYKPQNQFYKHLKLWRNVAFTAGILISVLGLEKVADIYQIEALADQYRTQSEATLRSVLPNNQRIPTVSYLRHLMNNETSRLSRSSEQMGFIMWLSELGLSLKSISGILLDSIRYDQKLGTLYFKARGKNFGDLDKLREMLATKYETEVGQTSREQENVTGEFVLKVAP